MIRFPKRDGNLYCPVRMEIPYYVFRWIWSLTFYFVCEFFDFQTRGQIVQVIFKGKIEQKKIKLSLVHNTLCTNRTKVQDAIFNAAAKNAFPLLCIYISLEILLEIKYSLWKALSFISSNQTISNHNCEGTNLWKSVV